MSVEQRRQGSPPEGESGSDAPSAAPSGEVTVERGVPYLGRPDHIRLRNREVELLLSTSYGPRIIRYAPIGGENVFAEMPPSASSGNPTRSASPGMSMAATGSGTRPKTRCAPTSPIMAPSTLSSAAPP